MKLTLTLCISAASMLITFTSKAQVTVASNFSPALGSPFVGWNAAFLSTPRPVDIKNNFASQNIDFYTNGTGANGSSIKRMTIIGSSGATQGFVGIGQGFTAPTSLLHVNGIPNNIGNVFRTDGNTAQLNQWQLYTNGAAGNTEKFRVEVLSGSSNVGLQVNQGNMYFGTTNTTRMHINEGCEGLILPVNIDSCCNALDNSSFC